MKIYNLGIIGCGNMAQAIIKALLKKKTQQVLANNDIKLKINVSDLDDVKLKRMKALGANIFTDNAEMIADCKYVLLAIKPQMAKDVLSHINLKEKIIISIMAGVSLEKLRNYTNATALVRVMPNLNARIGKSVNAFCCHNLINEQEKFVRLVLHSFGKEFEVEESMMNAVTGLTGSAPAFVFMFIESFINAGIKNGFNPLVARQMALATIIGSARLVESELKTDINTLVDNVCSKGGTTIEGVNFLKENQMENMIECAIKKSIERAGELERII